MREENIYNLFVTKDDKTIKDMIGTIEDVYTYLVSFLDNIKKNLESNFCKRNSKNIFNNNLEKYLTNKGFFDLKDFINNVPSIVFSEFYQEFDDYVIQIYIDVYSTYFPKNLKELKNFLKYLMDDENYIWFDDSIPINFNGLLLQYENNSLKINNTTILELKSLNNDSESDDILFIHNFIENINAITEFYFFENEYNEKIIKCYATKKIKLKKPNNKKNIYQYSNNLFDIFPILKKLI